MAWEHTPGNSAGSMNDDGSRKLLLHDTEGSSIEGAIAAYRANNSWPHLTVDCRRRRVVQHLPFNVAARSLQNLPGGADETNKDGSILIQIEIVGFVNNRDGTMFSGPDDYRWFGEMVVGPLCRAWSIPIVSTVRWTAYDDSYGSAAPQRLSVAAWDVYSGVLGHEHAPDNVHGDPGAIDVPLILTSARGDDMPLTTDDLKKVRGEVTAALKAMTRQIPGVGGGPNADAVWAKWLYDAARESLGDVDLTPATIAEVVAQQAPALATAIAAELGGSADAAQIEAAVRRVFGDAAAPG